MCFFNNLNNNVCILETSRTKKIDFIEHQVEKYL